MKTTLYTAKFIVAAAAIALGTIGTPAIAKDAADTDQSSFDKLNLGRSNFAEEAGSADWADNAGHAKKADDADWAKNADRVDGEEASNLGNGGSKVFNQIPYRAGAPVSAFWYGEDLAATVCHEKGYNGGQTLEKQYKVSGRYSYTATNDWVTRHVVPMEKAPVITSYVCFK